MQSYYNQNKKCPSSQEFTQKFPKPTGAYYPAYSNELPSDCSIVYYLLSERSYAIGTLVKESVGNFNSGQIEYYVVITP
jgi:hypothetical protein